MGRIPRTPENDAIVEKILIKYKPQIDAWIAAVFALIEARRLMDEYHLDPIVSSQGAARKIEDALNKRLNEALAARRSQ